MYRILKAAKDGYITNKYIAGTRSESSNTGLAGTVDLFKLYNETRLPGTSSVDVVELSRGLIKFDYAPLAALTASILDLNSPDFKCYLSLKDVYGGQTTPVNFTLMTIPLAQNWDEGKGQDVVVFRDLGTANFLTASVQAGVVNPWNLAGAAASGTLGDSNIDIIVSGNFGSGLVDLKSIQDFERGDEDLFVDITTHVSACLVGQMDNHGFRISLSDTEESDATTYFVKRFGTRHVQNKNLKPTLVVKADTALKDYSQILKFDTPFSQSVYTYNRINGQQSNFFSGSIEITGQNCMLLKLEASHSLTYQTSSFSISHNIPITHTVKGLDVFTTTITASQAIINGIPQTGIYTANVMLSTVDNIDLKAFLSGALEHDFVMKWTSLDGTKIFAQENVIIRTQQGHDDNVQADAYVANITNLKNTYAGSDQIRLRVFVQDYAQEMKAYRVPKKAVPKIIPNMFWRLVGAYSKKIYIPFDEAATRCSFDADGMYFDFWLADLDQNEVYEFELLIRENNKDYVITNEGFRFRVTG